MNDRTINADETLGGSEGTLLVNRYRIVRPLGQGGMGSVWLAADTQLDNREVAIKMLPSILVSNKRAYQQLKTEALVSLKLTHPNIATVRAFEENNGNPFLVVDYINGITLDDYLADVSGRADLCVGRDGARPSQLGLPEAEVIRLLTPIAAALDYAHSKGVVHRDVKPGNVMIAKDGTPYILDFGIAREIQETMTRVTGKLSSGTLMYMSPEQLHGAAPKLSQDVYSFAAMAYECLMGTPPFSRGQIEYQIEHDSPAPLGDHITICSQVMAGLAKSPEKRPLRCCDVIATVSEDKEKRAVPMCANTLRQNMFPTSSADNVLDFSFCANNIVVRYLVTCVRRVINVLRHDLKQFISPGNFVANHICARLKCHSCNEKYNVVVGETRQNVVCPKCNKTMSAVVASRFLCKPFLVSLFRFTNVCCTIVTSVIGLVGVIVALDSSYANANNFFCVLSIFGGLLFFVIIYRGATLGLAIVRWVATAGAVLFLLVVREAFIFVLLFWLIPIWSRGMLYWLNVRRFYMQGHEDIRRFQILLVLSILDACFLLPLIFVHWQFERAEVNEENVWCQKRRTRCLPPIESQNCCVMARGWAVSSSGARGRSSMTCSRRSVRS